MFALNNGYKSRNLLTCAYVLSLVMDLFITIQSIAFTISLFVPAGHLINCGIVDKVCEYVHDIICYEDEVNGRMM